MKGIVDTIAGCKQVTERARHTMMIIYRGHRPEYDDMEYLMSELIRLDTELEVLRGEKNTTVETVPEVDRSQSEPVHTDSTESSTQQVATNEGSPKGGKNNPKQGGARRKGRKA